jgi:hypothetical protein
MNDVARKVILKIKPALNIELLIDSRYYIKTMFFTGFSL